MKPGTTTIDLTKVSGSDGIYDIIEGRMDRRAHPRSTDIGGRVYFKLELNEIGSFEMVIALQPDGPWLFYFDLPRRFCSRNITDRSLFRWLATHAEDIILESKALKRIS